MRPSALERLREIRSAKPQQPIADPGETVILNDTEAETVSSVVPITPTDAVLNIVGRFASISHTLILKEIQGRGFSKASGAAAIGQLQAGRLIEHDLKHGYILSQAETDDVIANGNNS